MIIESGIIIFVGLLLLFIKLPRELALTLLGWPLALDSSVAVLAYMLHWGTFTGVMAAAVAGLMCSGFTSVGRYAFGYIVKGKYEPGKFINLGPSLVAARRAKNGRSRNGTAAA